MSFSRRRVLTLGSVSVLALTGGCSSRRTSTDAAATTTTTPTTATPTTRTDQPPVVARLVGPDTDRLLFRRSGVESAGSVRERDGQFAVPVALSESAVADVVERFGSAGVAGNWGEFSVVLSERGRAVTRFGVSPGLVEAVDGGDWRGELSLQFGERATAESVRQRLA